MFKLKLKYVIIKKLLKIVIIATNIAMLLNAKAKHNIVSKNIISKIKQDFIRYFIIFRKIVLVDNNF